MKFELNRSFRYKLSIKCKSTKVNIIDIKKVKIPVKDRLKLSRKNKIN